MKKIVTVALMAAITLVISATQAKAEDNPKPEKPEKRVQAQLLSSSTKAKIASSTSAKCEMVNSRIDLKIANFDNGQLRRVSSYQNMKDRLSRAIDKLTAKGVDTSDLKADLVMLDAKIAKLAQDYRAHVDGFRAAKNYDCGESQGQFRRQITESRRELSQVRKDVLDIRSFYATAIKPDLIKARNELKALRGTSTAPTSSTTATSSISQ